MRTATPAGALLALALTRCPLPTAHAGPADYVFTPHVEEGEREVDFKAGTWTLPDGGGRESAASVGLGWGATSWWFTEVYAKWHHEPGEPTSFDAWEWENKFQLTETGRYPVDVGFIVEIERPQARSEGYEYRWGPLFQTEFGPTVQANLNLLIEKHIRTDEPAPADAGYQWQVKYRYRPEFEFGAQGFGEMGPWNHWEPGSEQSHRAGPAVFGKVMLAPHQSITYNAAFLFALTDATPRSNFRMQVEYGF